MASIKVKFRPSTIPNHEGTIFYQIIHDRRTRLINTQYHVFKEEWDESRAIVIAKHTSTRMDFILSIRERIRWDIERLTKIDRTLHDRRMEYHADDIIEEFHEYEKRYSLFNYMEALIVKLKYNGNIRTSETYKAALNSFKNFRDGEDIMLEHMSSDVLEKYEAWHRQKGNTPNTISFYIRILRATYNRAAEDGIIENRNPFRRVYTGVEKTTKRALPLQYLKKIKALDLSLNPRLDFARDMFLMSFYLRGMSFVDMAYLRKCDLKNGHVVYRRRKTGQLLSIGWTKEMQLILDKYPANPTQYLLPIIRIEGCDERSMYKNMGDILNRNLKRIGNIMGLTMPLTMYVARHSWATTAKTKGIPVSVISEGMGHDSEMTTKIYLASLDTSVVDKANAKIIKSL